MVFCVSVTRREYSLRPRLALSDQFLQTTPTVNGETGFGQGQARGVNLILLNHSLEKPMGFHCLKSREISLTRLKQLCWIPSEAFWKFLTSLSFLQNAVQLISKKNTLCIASWCVQSPLSNNREVCLGNLPYLAKILLHSPYSMQFTGPWRKPQAFAVLIAWCFGSWERKCSHSCTVFMLVNVLGVQWWKEADNLSPESSA